MAEENGNRRLAAILAADVVGYSRLMEANEDRTMGALKHHRAEFFDPTISKHGGRIFKVMGDGFLVEFGSVLRAAKCAVEIQLGMPQRNAGVPEDRKIKFRIGIHVADIIVEDDDFFGDGVNIAVRLEGLASPGGISCSATVRSQIGNKLGIGFLDQGLKALKNISAPVHVYFVNLAKESPITIGVTVPFPQRDKPSIAVLPFTNMSSDPDQEFFSDGITEDIITDLSKVSGLFVLGRNTVFTLKGRAIDLEEAAKQLGVSFLIEGSVRKVGNRVRITAQLIEGSTGGHLWAERYDRDLTDIFAVQDEITQTIVAQLSVILLPEEKAAIEIVPTVNVEAYTTYLRGRQIWYHGTKAGSELAHRMFMHAVTLDPSFALAYVGMANCASTLLSVHGVKTPVADILTLANRAVSLQPNLAEAHASRGYALILSDYPDDAVPALVHALELDSNCIDAHEFLARYYTTTGVFDLAAEHYIRSLELQPDDFQAPLMLRQVLVSLGRTDEAESYTRIGLKRAEAWMESHPEDSKPAQLGAIGLAFLGERDRAREWMARALTIDPEDNLARYNAACTYALLGDLDKSIELLEIYLKEVSKDLRTWSLHDSDLDAIRKQPGYLEILGRYKEPIPKLTP